MPHRCSLFARVVPPLLTFLALVFPFGPLGPLAPRASYAAGGDRVVVAVSYFDNTGGSAELDPLKKGLADMLITDLAISEEVTVVERERLNDLLGEIRLQKSPYFDKKGAAKLGRGLGAAYLITGAFLVADKTLRIDVRVIDVETAEIALTAKEEGPLADFFAVEQRLATQLLTGLGAELTLLQKKRIGAQGTRKLDAFRAYSKALDARDRGDKDAEKKALEAALAADPEFAKVKARLAALETKVAALEKSGGRIINPTEAHQFLHNARIQKAEGDYDGAKQSLQSAMAKNPVLIDLWLATAQMRDRRAFDADALRAPKPLQPILSAYLAGDAAVLHGAVKKDTHPHRLHAAALLIDVVRAELPGRRIAPYTMLRDAAQVLFAAERERRLASVFIDHVAFVREVESLQTRYLEGARAAQITYPARMAIRNTEAILKTTSWFQGTIELFERPAAPIEITLDRDTSHPHWREKATPRRKDRLVGMWASYSQSRRDALQKAAEQPSKFLYRFDSSYEDPYKGGTLPGAVEFGQSFEAPASELDCRDDADSLTGARCYLQLDFFKPSLLPGRYLVTLRYRDSAGAQITREIRPWVFDFTLIPHRRVVAGGLAIYGPPDRKVIVLHPTHAAELEKNLLGKRRFKVAAETWVTSYTHDIDVYFDVNYSLSSGKPPSGEDGRAWMEYRDRIIQRGYQIHLEDNDGHVPLPDLAVGEHTLCLAGVRKNGSKTPEAECYRIEVKHYD